MLRRSIGPLADFGHPSGTARRVMACNLKQQPKAERWSMPNCIRDTIDEDSRRSLMVQWAIGVATALAILGLHTWRLTKVITQSTPEERAFWNEPYGDVSREIAVFLLVVLGLVIFVWDVHHCRTTVGLLKVIVFLVVADILIPSMWYGETPSAHLTGL